MDFRRLTSSAHALAQPFRFGCMRAVYCERPCPFFCECPDGPEHEQHVHFDACLGLDIGEGKRCEHPVVPVITNYDSELFHKVSFQIQLGSRVTAVSASSETAEVTNQPELCRAIQSRAAGRAGYFLGWTIRDRRVCPRHRTVQAHVSSTRNRSRCLVWPGPLQSSANTSEARMGGNYSSARSMQRSLVAAPLESCVEATQPARFHQGGRLAGARVPRPDSRLHNRRCCVQRLC